MDWVWYFLTLGCTIFVIYIVIIGLTQKPTKEMSDEEEEKMIEKYYANEYIYGTEDCEVNSTYDEEDEFREMYGDYLGWESPLDNTNAEKNNGKEHEDINQSLNEPNEEMKVTEQKSRYSGKEIKWKDDADDYILS